MNKFSVYVLLSNSKPIYVGTTQDVQRRLKEHSKKIDYDFHVIVKSYESKKDAFNAENAILRYESLFNCNNLKNVKDKSLSGKSIYIKKI